MSVIILIAPATFAKPAELSKYTINQKIGATELDFLFFKVYDIALYGGKKPFSYNRKFAISIDYNMNIPRFMLINSSIDEKRRYYEIDEKTEEKYRAKLEEVFPAVKYQDRISAVFLPKNKLVFYHNGEKTGEIKDMKFARQFVDIWLHPDNHYASKRCELIGNTNCD